MYASDGRLQYGPGIRLVAWIDKGIADFYRKLIPKYCYPQVPMYPPHITIVRTAVETPLKMEFWNKYEGQEVAFEYSSDIDFNGTYFYLRVQSDCIGDIREELGLPRFRFGDLGAERQCYHTTIANVKGPKNERQQSKMGAG